MTAVKALLVDMDGTLVDTAEANFLAYAEALQAAGVTVTREAFDQVALGRNWRQFLPALMEGNSGGADPAAVAARKAQLYPEKIRHTLVNDALVGLIAAGRAAWKTALVTTASAANVEAVLSYHKLRDLFDLVVTGSDVTHHKPHPEAYQLAASRLGFAPSECLVIEDSAIGVASAKAFGSPCIKLSFPIQL